MKLSLAEPRLLVDSIGVISELVNDVKIKFDKDKIEIIAMDPANVAMIVFKLLSSAFTEYKVEKNAEIGVSLDSLKAVLRRAKQSDVLTIELDEEKSRLKIQLKSESTRTFNLALIDIDEKEQKVPDLKFPLRVETSTMVFDEAVQDMDVVAESVALIAEKSRFIVEAEGNLKDARAEILSDDETKIKLEGSGPLRSKYSIEYLKKIIKASKLANSVVLQFDKDYPLRVDYLVKDKLSLSVILAPRVSND